MPESPNAEQGAFHPPRDRPPTDSEVWEMLHAGQTYGQLRDAGILPQRPERNR